MKRIALVTWIIATLFAVAPPAFAGVEVNTAPGDVLVDGKPAPGLGVHGFDVVAYHTQAKPVQGDAKFAVVHANATYRFASKKNLETFKANPAKYEPAFGGYCAYGVSVNAKFDGDPRVWKIVDGKLYLNLDQQIQRAFEKDVAGSIRKAYANWRKLKNKHPSELYPLPTVARAGFLCGPVFLIKRMELPKWISALLPNPYTPISTILSRSA